MIEGGPNPVTSTVQYIDPINSFFPLEQAPPLDFGLSRVPARERVSRVRPQASCRTTPVFIMSVRAGLAYKAVRPGIRGWV